MVFVRLLVYRWCVDDVKDMMMGTVNWFVCKIDLLRIVLTFKLAS